MSLAKVLITTGIILVTLGLAIHFGGKFNFFGKLPGDILIDRGDTKIFIPITSSIVFSLILSLLLWLINKLRG